MKTYEETAAALISRKAEYEKNKESRRLRLSLIAAIAAAVILLTSIPVGAVIIGSSAKEPIAEDTAATTDNTPHFEYSDETVKEYLRNPSAFEQSPQKHQMSSRYEGVTDLAMKKTEEPDKKVPGGYLHSLTFCIRHVFTSEYANYQFNVILDIGDGEKYQIVYRNEKSVEEGYTIVAVTFDLFIPDGVEYGEVYAYFNLLASDTDEISEYDVAPFGKRCLNFYKKYGVAVYSEGADAPKLSRGELTEYFNDNIHSAIYGSVEELYLVNENLKNGLSYNGENEDNTHIRQENGIKNLTEFKKDYPGDYAEIIKEFCENGTEKVYNSNGELIRESHYRHDPLEDINSDTTSNKQIQNPTDDENHESLLENTELTTYVVGSVFWNHPYRLNTSYLPVKNITIDCYNISNNNYTLLGTTNTNENGTYYVNFVLPANTEINIKTVMVVSGLNITVKDTFMSQRYSKDIGISYNVLSGTIINNGVTNITNNDGILLDAISIHQSLIMANQYMYALENSYMQHIDVFYADFPFFDTFYDNLNETISIGYEKAFAWDDSQRAYGQFVAHKKGLMADNAYGNNDHLADLSALYGKPTGIICAWYDGFATFFAINVQRVMVASDLNILYAGDLSYDSGFEEDSIHFNIETNIDSHPDSICAKCDANEMTVAGILLDFVDGYESASAGDLLSCNNTTIWNLIQTNHCQTLMDFVDEFMDSTQPNLVKLCTGYTFEWFDLAAKDPVLYSYIFDRPFFQWSAPNSTGDFSYTISFYDINSNLINEYYVGANTYVWLPTSVWTAATNGRTEIFAVVQTVHLDDDIDTGPYVSHPVLITLA